MPYSIHVPHRSKDKRAGTYLEQLLRWADERAKAGIPRQALSDALLRAPDISLGTFLEMPVPERHVCLDEKGARIKAARSVAQVMINRDLNGRALEREGNIEDAVRLYEANLSDGYTTNTSYERLRTIYTERMDYAAAIRVCYAYLLIAKNNGDAEQFQRYLDDLLSRPSERAVERTVLDIVIART
jgi:tetratricopeptide (TPR) repeat protein